MVLTEWPGAACMYISMGDGFVIVIVICKYAADNDVLMRNGVVINQITLLLSRSI